MSDRSHPSDAYSRAVALASDSRVLTENYLHAINSEQDPDWKVGALEVVCSVAIAYARHLEERLKSHHLLDGEERRPVNPESSDDSSPLRSSHGHHSQPAPLRSGSVGAPGPRAKFKTAAQEREATARLYPLIGRVENVVPINRKRQTGLELRPGA